MSADIRISETLWEEDGEGVIATWLFADGEMVTAGAVVAEAMYEKASMEILAPASGILSILVAPEQPVRKGQLIARIG